jgi:DNA-nicking Smr family endonuclease
MRSPPDDEDFRRATVGVKPIAAPRRRAPAAPRPAPVPNQTLLDERAALAESIRGPVSAEDAIDSGEELAYARDGISRQTLRKLRRGHWVVQDDLDLHGMNRIEAAESVAAFLRNSSLKGLRCERIVHGKGLGSRNREPVLKSKLRGWLEPRDEVLGFCQAPNHHGGSGALLVLLKPGTAKDAR